MIVAFLAIMGDRNRKGPAMRKKIFSIILSLAMFITLCIPASASELKNPNSQPSTRSTYSVYLIEEAGYLSSNSNFYTATGNSKVYSHQRFTISVNFRCSNGGSAKLKIGDFFEHTIPCDGTSRTYNVYTSLNDVPITWEITNHPAGLAYSVRMYTS